MTQNEKELLFEDLCARIPYLVKVNITNRELKNRIVELTEDNICHLTNDWWDECKPYLYPLSSMTDKLWDKEFSECGITEFTRDSFKYGCETLEFNNSNPSLSNMVRFTNLLIKNHFDIHGLIPMGLAIDASKLNIY